MTFYLASCALLAAAACATVRHLRHLHRARRLRAKYRIDVLYLDESAYDLTPGPIRVVHPGHVVTGDLELAERLDLMYEPRPHKID